MSNHLNRPWSSDSRHVVRAATLASILAVPGAIILALGTVVGTLKALFPSEDIPAEALFNLNGEANVWSWYSSLLLAFLSLLLILHAVISPPAVRLPFVLFAALALFLSIDEAAVLHEKVTSALLAGDLATGAWLVIQAPLAVSAVVAAYLLGRQLASPLRRRLAIAALIYVSGAIGVEAAEVAFQYAAALRDLEHASIPYLLARSLEEGLEVLGILFALWAVLSEVLISITDQGLSVELRTDPADRRLRSATS